MVNINKLPCYDIVGNPSFSSAKLKTTIEDMFIPKNLLIEKFHIKEAGFISDVIKIKTVKDTFFIFSIDDTLLNRLRFIDKVYNNEKTKKLLELINFCIDNQYTFEFLFQDDLVEQLTQEIDKDIISKIMGMKK